MMNLRQMVYYIAGASRSGITLFGIILGKVGNHRSLGELIFFLSSFNAKKLARISIKRSLIIAPLCLAFLMSLPYLVLKLAELIQYLSLYIVVLPCVPWMTDHFNFSVRDFLGVLIDK